MAKYMVPWGITWRHPNQKSFGRAHAMGASEDFEGKTNPKTQSSDSCLLGFQNFSRIWSIKKNGYRLGKKTGIRPVFKPI